MLYRCHRSCSASHCGSCIDSFQTFTSAYREGARNVVYKATLHKRYLALQTYQPWSLLSMIYQAQAHKVIIYTFNIYCDPTICGYFGRHLKHKDKWDCIGAVNECSLTEKSNVPNAMIMHCNEGLHWRKCILQSLRWGQMRLFLKEMKVKLKKKKRCISKDRERKCYKWTWIKEQRHEKMRQTVVL